MVVAQWGVLKARAFTMKAIQKDKRDKQILEKLAKEIAKLEKLRLKKCNIHKIYRIKEFLKKKNEQKRRY